MDRIDFEADVIRRNAMRQKMDIVDSLSPEWRAVIHEYGLHIVRTCIEAGVRKPNSVAQVVAVIRDHYLGHPVDYSALGKRPWKRAG